MKKYLFHIILLFLCGLTTACKENNAAEEAAATPDGTREAIALSSSDTGELSCAGINDFPNEKRIGVLAAYYNEGGVPDWSAAGYPDIDNSGATAAGVDGEVFSFTWDEVKYWPFNSAELVFAAYSPVIGNGNDIYLSEGRDTMYITLHDGMPDVLYASNNYTAKDTPYSKLTTDIGTGDPKIVDLGEFRHALAKLTVEVYADSGMNPDIKVTKLVVSTTQKKAALDMFGDETSQLTLEDPEITPFQYAVIPETTYANGQAFSGAPISEAVLLFPATEDITEVSISFADHADNSVSSTKILSTVANKPPGAGNLTLQKGMNTTLRFTVKSTEVINPAEDVYLQGTLSGWNEAGDFEIIIQ